jgi:hypothetical protein
MRRKEDEERRGGRRGDEVVEEEAAMDGSSGRGRLHMEMEVRWNGRENELR